MASAHPTISGPQTVGTERRAEAGEAEESPGYGWVVYAGIMIVIAGTLNMIYGIAAIANSSFYAANTHFVFSDLKTWGWIVTLIGAFQLCVALGVFVRAQWARWTGVFIAGLSAIAQLMFLAATPWLSVAIFALDMLVIYGLVTYGSRLEHE